MDRIAATLGELDELVKSAIPNWDFGGKMRHEIQLVESNDACDNDVCDIETKEFFVVGNVQENAVWIRQWRHSCASFPAPWSSPALVPDCRAWP
jgi:hypothetical protein